VKIETKQFGRVEIDDDKVFTMPDGMPGFLGMKRFVIIDREETWPFQCYQCLDDAGLCFYIMNPYLFKADYDIDMTQIVREAGWKGDNLEDIKLYVIVNTSSGIPEKITANLIGPLLINTRRFEATQLVLANSPYSHQHLIFASTSDKKSGSQKAVSA
jgi:flagellar assembly factor FliW